MSENQPVYYRSFELIVPRRLSDDACLKLLLVIPLRKIFQVMASRFRELFFSSIINF